MLHLYDINKNKIAGLVHYKDIAIEKVLKTGDSTLSFSYPQKANYSNFLMEESYIRTKNNEFVIKEISLSRDYLVVKCVLNIEDLEGNVFDRFESIEKTIDNSLNLALAGTGWTIQLHDTITKKRTVKKTRSTSWDIIQDIKNTYNVEMTFDAINKKVNIYEHIGSDKGAYFIESLNVKALDVSKNSYDFCTRIIPIGKDGLDICSVNGGKNYVENYQYSKKIKTLQWKDDRYTLPQNLKEDAQAKLDELSKPYRSYSAEIIDLAKISDKYKNILDYYLGDTITLISKDKRIHEKQRIVKITEHPLEPEKNTCEIANTIISFEETQKKLQDASDTVSNITTDNGTVKGSAVDNIEVTQINNFEANVARVTNLEVVRADIQTLKAGKADIQELNAVTARIGTLQSTVAYITDLRTINARIDNLNVEKANVSDLTAASAKIKVLESHTASIDNVLAGNITAKNIATGTITASSGIIAAGAIGDAQISSISANKLTAGTIDTSKIQILGANGRLKITGNKLQVLDNKNGTLYERIMLGVDDKNNSALILRGADGKTTLLDQDGLTNAGFTTGYGKVNENSLDASKFNMNSLVRQVNGATETIKGTKIQVGDRTLDVELSTQKNIITDHGKELATQKSSIQALDNKISLKVDNQTFVQATNTINNTITNNKAQLIDNIQKSIDNIKVGGNNLILNSNFAKGFNNWKNQGGFVLSKENNDNIVSIHKSGLNDFGYAGLFSSQVQAQPDQEYTLSLDFKIADNNLYDSKYLCVFEFFNSVGQRIEWHDVSITDFKINPENNKWYRGYFTYKPIDKTIQKLGVRLCLFKNGTVSYKKIKVECGNKATQFCIAQEDIDEDLKKYTDEIAKAKAENALQNSKLYTTEQITTVNNNFNKATSEINILKNQINLKVEKTDIDNAIKTVVIGGRNLALGTAKTHTQVGRNSSNQTSTMYNLVIPELLGVNITVSYDWEVTSNTFSGFFNIQLNNMPYAACSTQVKPSAANKKGTICYSTTFPQTVVATGVMCRMDQFVGTLNITKFKIEKGNKKTDWTPAPEDLDKQIADIVTSTTEKINSAKSEITQTTNSIKQSVSILDSKTTTIQNQVNTKATKQELQVVASKAATLETNLNGITGKVTSVEENFKNMDIGCRNLLSNTYKFNDLSNWGLSKGANQNGILEIVNDPRYGNVIHTTKPNSGSWWVLGNYLIRLPEKKFTPGKDYTISFYAKAKEPVSIWIAFADASGMNSIAEGLQFDLTAEWKYYSSTIRARFSGNAPQMYITSNIGEHWWTMFKLEEGNIPTAWTPAPEDTETEIKKVSDKVAEIKITTDGISSKVSAVESRTTTLGSSVSVHTTQINQLKSEINSKVTSGQVSSLLRQDSQSLQVGFNGISKNIEMKQDGFYLLDDGRNTSMSLTRKTLSIYNSDNNYAVGQLGFTSLNNDPSKYGISLNIERNAAYMDFSMSKTHMEWGLRDSLLTINNTYLPNGRWFIFHETVQFNKYVEYWANMNMHGWDIYGVGDLKPEGSRVQIGDKNDPKKWGALACGDFNAYGSKNSVSVTKSYGERLINAYETADYYFGDLGSATIGEDGLCYISIDVILLECVNTKVNYHVFLQKCGPGDLWIKEKFENYFIVAGTPNLKFSWEFKAKRIGYENNRLEELEQDSLDKISCAVNKHDDYFKLEKRESDPCKIHDNVLLCREQKEINDIEGSLLI